MSLFLTNLLHTSLFVLPPYLLLRFLFLRRDRVKSIRWGREALLLFFTCFSVGLAALLFTPGPMRNEALPVFSAVAERLREQEGINLQFFSTIRASTGGHSVYIFLIFVANVLMFVPLGFFPPLLWRRWQSPKRLVLLALLLPLAIEFIQLWVGRSVDVDDCMLNTLGILLGGGLSWLLWRVCPACRALASGKMQKDPLKGKENETLP